MKELPFVERIHELTGETVGARMSTIASVYASCCERRFPSCTDSDVIELENRLSARLPPDYRSFLLEFNGGYFNEPLIRGDCPTDALNALKGIAAPAEFAVLGSTLDLALFEENDPLCILPIGNTVTGSLILLDTVENEDEFGSIGLTTPRGHVYWLAAGIVEFFSLLEVPDESSRSQGAP